MLRFKSQKLLDWKTAKSRKPLILLGARQVGKTYLLKEFAHSAFENSVYINFESDRSLHRIFGQDLNPSFILRELEKLGHQIVANKTLLIFDEIQACPDALTSLKYFYEQLPNLHICAAGSLLGLHLAESSFPVGKVDLVHIEPLTFKEFLRGIGDDALYQHINEAEQNFTSWSQTLHPRLFDRFKDYLIVGGLPEVVVEFAKYSSNLHEAYTHARRLQENLIVQYLADIAKHSGKTNSMHIERIWNSTATQLANTHDGRSDKFKFKGVIPNIRGYERLANAIDWLQKAGLILRVPICKSSQSPLSAYCEESTFKLYMFDVGILGAMIQLHPTSIVAYDFGTYKGYLAENFVAQELTAYGFNLFCWREGTAEVDFLIDKGTDIIPIEVKSGLSTKAKSLGVYQKKYHPQQILKISGRWPDASSDPTIKNLPLYALNTFAKERI